MRMIGYLGDEGDARTFSDFLYVKGIKSEVEPDREGVWAIWVHGEDEIDSAKDLLGAFRSNSQDPEYKRVAKQARELREQEEEKEAAAAKRYFEGRKILRRMEGFGGMGRLTMILLVTSVLAFLIGRGGENSEFYGYFSISEYDTVARSARLEHGLPEIRNGQIWRIVTPIFLHFGILHIFFNMLWLRDLGSVVESRQGSWFFAMFVVVIGAASNVGQYLVAGPSFGGMSGIVYALLGYVWMKATYDPRSGYFLHESTVVMMLIWFVLGFTGILNIANTVHAVGLAGGVAWGYLSAKRAR